MPSRVLAELLAVVAPPACAACRAPLARAELRLCSDCTRALPWMPVRACRRCGLPSHRRGCPAGPAAFTRAWAPLAYDGVARDLVAALKFGAALPVATLMAAHMAANLPADLRSGSAESQMATALVPVPPQSRARPPARVRPGGRARRLRSPRGSGCPRARACAAATARAARSARRARSGAVPAACRSSSAAAPPARALLVDDVHTTGATLDACAHALAAGGCGEVVALTYARTL